MRQILEYCMIVRFLHADTFWYHQQVKIGLMILVITIFIFFCNLQHFSLVFLCCFLGFLVSYVLILIGFPLFPPHFFVVLVQIITHLERLSGDLYTGLLQIWYFSFFQILLSLLFLKSGMLYS